jgi:single-strand DNA-binding protein
MADNTLTIVGNMVRDPELKFSNGGIAITRITVAVSRKKGDEEYTGFFDVVCFGSLAENVANSLHKGNRVIVSGRLEQATWETEDKQKKSKIEILADAVGPDLRWNLVNIEAGLKKPAKSDEYAF